MSTLTHVLLLSLLPGLGNFAGGLVAALLALGGGIQPAGMAMGRLLAGVMLKWVVVFAVLTLGLAAFKLPPLPMLVGVLAATLAFVLANLLKR